MNITWSQIIDQFKTPDDFLKSIESYDIMGQTTTMYHQASNWVNYQQYQIMGNYPSLYSWFTSYSTLGNIVLIVMMLWLVDNLVVKRFFNKARWFILHVIGNAFVVYHTWSDLSHLITNPIASFSREPHYEALNITVAIHFYHALFFSNLVAIDWIHHILMISIAIGSYFCPSPVIITTNGLLFFLNGLPGGLDYLLLSLVKYEWIRPIREKELNSYLNIWVRSPGVLIGTYNMFLTTVYANYKPHWSTAILVLTILIWNAQYFTYRVVGNYFARLTEKCVQFEKREGRTMSVGDELKCITEEDSIINEIDVLGEINDIEEIPLSKPTEDENDNENDN